MCACPVAPRRTAAGFAGSAAAGLLLGGGGGAVTRGSSSSLELAPKRSLITADAAMAGDRRGGRAARRAGGAHDPLHGARSRQRDAGESNAARPRRGNVS